MGDNSDMCAMDGRASFAQYIDWDATPLSVYSLKNEHELLCMMIFVAGIR